MQTRSQKILNLLLVLSQRLAFGLLVLLAIVYLSYFGLDMARGVPFQDALAGSVEKSLGYFGRLSRADFGETLSGSLSLRVQPVVEVVPTVVARSLGLLGAALLIAAPVGIALGVWAARSRHTRWSLVTLLASITGVSIPSFFAALLLQMGVLWLTRTTGRTWLPVGGFGWDAHLLLPAIVLAARPLAQIARVTFVSMNDVLAQDYVRTAYSKGLTGRLVMNRHVFRNIAVPVLTTLGLSLRFSLSSLPVVEYFFSWPGLGFTLLKSISRQDDNLTVILILVLGLLFILVNLTLELAYRLIDPRLRAVPEHVSRSEQAGCWASWRTFLSDAQAFLKSRPLQRWLDRRQPASAPSPFQEVLAERGNQVEAGNHYPGDRRAWLQGTLANLPLMAGALFVIGLLALVALGPQLTPHSPYTTQGLQIVDGQFRVPPFAPEDLYLWGTDVLGRDLLSLIIAGVQQTMFLAVLVVLARMVIGFLLGALAGWLNGGWLDRALLGIAETIAGFPTLLLAMTLILALGIRNGLRPFVIALSFVGWGEIMQYVRSEVMNIRPKVFIESAIALGVRTPRIILSHVLPNLVPALISIAALEMGAVLMLLGELGFIGIFIGGGAFAELDVAAGLYHYSDIPEWGALLSNVRNYARAYPWTAFYPALAFFLAILGFNMFGEGMRRLIEIVGVRIMRLFNRYTLGLAVVLAGGFLWVRGNTGALAYYQQQAAEFDGQMAYRYVQALTAPEMEGRALDSRGQHVAALFIAQQFAALGIQPAGDNLTYFQPRSRSYQSLDAIPSLQILDGGPAPVYHQDFVELPAEYRNLGAASGSVKVLGFRELRQTSGYLRSYRALNELELEEDILLLLSSEQVPYLDDVPRAGLLVVADEPADLQRRYTVSSLDPNWRIFGAGRLREYNAPMLWISEQLAERLLAGSGASLESLRRDIAELGNDEILTWPTETQVTMEVSGTTRPKVPVTHVLGHWPGAAAGGGPDTKLDDELIIVLARYDAPPLGPDGEIYPGANDNASALAVMLETIHTMRATGYQPNRSLLFVAFSGEGYEGGEPVVPEVSKLLQTKYGFSTAFTVAGVIELRALGGEQGDHLELQTSGSLRLANLFEDSARRMGVPVKRAAQNLDISIVFDERSSRASGEEAPGIGLVWEGWQPFAGTSFDTLQSLSVEHLQDAGRTLTLALMTMGRERDY